MNSRTEMQEEPPEEPQDEEDQPQPAAPRTLEAQPEVGAQAADLAVEQDNHLEEQDGQPSAVVQRQSGDFPSPTTATAPMLLSARPIPPSLRWSAGYSPNETYETDQIRFGNMARFPSMAQQEDAICEENKRAIDRHRRAERAAKVQRLIARAIEVSTGVERPQPHSFSTSPTEDNSALGIETALSHSRRTSSDSNTSCENSSASNTEDGLDQEEEQAEVTVPLVNSRRRRQSRPGSKSDL